MPSLKLQSSDGVIFNVDAATVKQMVTVQTMIDHEDEDSDEVTPVPTVKAQVLEKIIQWIEYHKIDHDTTSRIAWTVQYFDVELKKMFEIIIAADYLEIKSLLHESCQNVFIKHKWKIIEDAADSFYHPTVVRILRSQYKYIVVSIQDKDLRCFDPKVRRTVAIICPAISSYLICSYTYFRLKLGHICQLFQMNSSQLDADYVS